MPLPDFLTQSIPALATVTGDQLFAVTNVVLPAWVLVAVAPRSKLTKLAVTFAVTVLSVIYALGLAAIIPTYGGFMGLMSKFTTLDGVTDCFSNRTGVLVGWLHYGVTDLTTGWWIALDAQNKRIHKVITFFCLVGTMFFGPCGVLLYLIVRELLGKEPNLGKKRSKKE